MNIRKNIDYSGLYAEIDKALATGLSQLELYLELGRLISNRPEKGAAVIVAECITTNYPDQTGFFPRNLRRMRNFYRMVERIIAIEHLKLDYSLCSIDSNHFI